MCSQALHDQPRKNSREWKLPRTLKSIIVLILTSSTITLFFEITKFSKILSKLTFFSKIFLSSFVSIFEICKCKFRKYFRKFCHFENNVNGRWSHCYQHNESICKLQLMRSKAETQGFCMDNLFKNIFTENIEFSRKI